MKIFQRNNFSILFFIVSIILLISFVIYPALKEISINSKEVISQKEKLISLEFKIENLEGLRIGYGQLSPELEKINNLFINHELPIEFISFLEGIAKTSKVEIKISLASFNKAEKEKWAFLNLQINAIGSFPQFLSFLEKIETAPYLTEIQNLSVNGSKEENKVQTALSLKAFAY